MELKKVLKITLKILLGIILILIGISGIILPLIPGWILIFIGLGFLGYHPLKYLIKYLKKKLNLMTRN